MGGVTPLIMCVKMASHSMLQQLITKNVDIAATDNEGKKTNHYFNIFYIKIIFNLQNVFTCFYLILKSLNPLFLYFFSRSYSSSLGCDDQQY